MQEQDNEKVVIGIAPQEDSRDCRNIGTWGTGDLELTLRSRADMERALPLLARSYTEN